MSFIPLIILCIIAILVATITIRIHLKNESKKLSERLSYIPSYNDEQTKERLSALNNRRFIDIPTDLNNGFDGKIISSTQEKDFINYYKPHFHKAYSLLKKLEAFNITPSTTISKFINEFL